MVVQDHHRGVIAMVHREICGLPNLCAVGRLRTYLANGQLWKMPCFMLAHMARRRHDSCTSYKGHKEVKATSVWPPQESTW